MLYLVPTPIGNREDITLRALNVLRDVDVILAEDTRSSGRLLDHFSIKTPVASFHAFNEHKVLEKYLEELQSGKSIALISDAGTPGISDPGYLLVRACAERDIPLSVLPGPTAFVPAIVMSAIPAQHFHYEGFLPHKKGRKSRIQYLAQLESTIVMYESPHRLVKCLNEFAAEAGSDRKAAVIREISKLHETAHRGSLQELTTYFEANPPKGEIAVVIAGANVKAD